MAVDFDGSSDYLSQSSALVSAPPVSMACWAHLDTTAGDQYLMSLGWSGGTTDYIFLTARSGGGAYGGVFNSPNGKAWETTANFGTSAYHHFGMRLWGSSGSYSARAYLDGDNTGSYILNQAATAPTLDRTSIGALLRSSAAAHTNGRIADAAIWSTELSDAEFSAMASGVSPLLIRPNALVSYCGLIDTSLQEAISAAWTTNGTPANGSDHPRTIRPSAQILPFPPAAVGGGGGGSFKGLTLLGVG